MKSILFTLLFAAITAVCHASDPTPPDTAKKQTPTDAFSALLLEKARLYTDKAEAVAGKAVDAVVREAPVVVEEFLRWKLWYHGVSFAVFALLFYSFLTVALYFGSKLKRYKTDGYFVAVVVSGIFSAFSLAFMFKNIAHLLSFIQILVAPRIYLLEQAANLFK